MPQISLAAVMFCADDYALNTPISAAILDLIARKRLQATSCMTQAPDWPAHGQALKTLHETHPEAQIGLHFNLTHDFADGMYVQPLNILMLKAWLRQIPEDAITQTLQYQWQRFIDVFGRMPDFIDGHQHVHQFPIIRDVLICFLKEHGFNGWVRGLQHTVTTPGQWLKSTLLPRLGAYTLARRCSSTGISQNAYFGGIYDFTDRKTYADLIRYWFRHHPAHTAGSGTAGGSLLIMCHPATDAADLSDPIRAARLREYDYFGSNQFLQDVTDGQMTLSTASLPSSTSSSSTNLPSGAP